MFEAASGAGTARPKLIGAGAKRRSIGVCPATLGPCLFHKAASRAPTVGQTGRYLGIRRDQPVAAPPRAGTCWPRSRSGSGAMRVRAVLLAAALALAPLARPGRRPHRLVGQGLLPGGGPGPRGADPGLRGEDGPQGRAGPARRGTCRRRRGRDRGRSAARFHVRSPADPGPASSGGRPRTGSSTSPMRGQPRGPVRSRPPRPRDGHERPHRPRAASTRCRWGGSPTTSTSG